MYINDNGSTLPEFISRTNESLSQINVTRGQIVKIINNFNSKKAHGYDGISIAMLKLCITEVAKPLEIIFSECINFGAFSDSWKYANISPIHKKDNRQVKKITDLYRCYRFVVKF